MRRHSSKFDAWIDQLANRNLAKGIKPAVVIMLLILALSSSVIYYGFTLEYEVKPSPHATTENPISKLPHTIRLLDLLMDTETN